MIGHRATDGYEPRQVRKEAAISNVRSVSRIDPGQPMVHVFQEMIRQRVHNLSAHY